MKHEFFEIIPKQHPLEGITLVLQEKSLKEKIAPLGNIALFDWEFHAPELSTIGERVDEQVFAHNDSVDSETFRRIVRQD